MTKMVKSVYNSKMRTVNIANLKAHFSAHLQMVRDGEEVLVCDRNKPVVRIVPCVLEDQPERERDLIARGILTPPLKRRIPSKRWPEPSGRVSDEVMRRVWQEERKDR